MMTPGCLTLILYWGYLWLFFTAAGFLGLRVLAAVLPHRMEDYRLSDLTWGGLAFITAIALLASLRLPLAGAFHVAALAGVAGLTVLDRRALAAYARARLSLSAVPAGDRWRVPLAALLVGAVVVCTAIVSNGPPTEYDTLLYHAKSVRWLKEFAAIPGLANLDGHYGFNNAWFATAAFVDVGPFAFKSFHVVGGFVYVLAIGTLFSRFVAGMGRGFTCAWLFDAALLYPLLQYWGRVNSLSTDLIASLLVFAIVSHTLRLLERPGLAPGALGWSLLVVPFAVTVKLINLPLLLLIPLLVLHQAWVAPVPDARPARRRLLLAAVLIPALVMLPWLVRNVILTGYLVFPFAGVDVFAVDWKVPRELVDEEANITRTWARIPGRPMADVLPLSLSEWWPYWPDRRHHLITGLLFWSVTAGLALALFRRHLQRPVSRYWPVLAMLAAGLAYWFVQAPAVRYGYGYLVAAQVLIIALLADLILRSADDQARKAAALVLLIAAGFALHAAATGALAVRMEHGDTLTEYPRVPVAPYTYPSGLTVEVPTAGDCCINEPGLCSSCRFRDRYDLSLRGTSVADGFRHTPRIPRTP